MKIRGRLSFRSDDAGELVNTIARSLEPDNLPETSSDKTSAAVMFSADKIGTMISSIDDYLMNAKIAYDIICRIKENPGKE